MLPRLGRRRVPSRSAHCPRQAWQPWRRGGALRRSVIAGTEVGVSPGEALALKTVLLVNPASANGRRDGAGPSFARAAHAAGIRGEAIFSERPGQLGDLAREAADDGAELLVVFGGDGTVHEVVNGIAGRGASSSPSSSRARAGLRSHQTSRSSTRSGYRAGRRGAPVRPRPCHLSSRRSRRDGVVRECRQRRYERRHRGEGEQHDEGLRRQDVVPDRARRSSRAGRTSSSTSRWTARRGAG